MIYSGVWSLQEVKDYLKVEGISFELFRQSFVKRDFYAVTSIRGWVKSLRGDL